MTWDGVSLSDSVETPDAWWLGYKLHVSETAGRESRLITDVDAVPAMRQDDQCRGAIQDRLVEPGIPAGEQYVDQDCMGGRLRWPNSDVRPRTVSDSLDCTGRSGSVRTARSSRFTTGPSGHRKPCTTPQHGVIRRSPRIGNRSCPSIRLPCRGRGGCASAKRWAARRDACDLRNGEGRY